MFVCLHIYFNNPLKSSFYCWSSLHVILPLLLSHYHSGPDPPVIDVISSSSQSQLFVSWTSHCTNDSCDGLSNDKKPKKYIITYASTDDGISYSEEVLSEPEGSNYPPTSITLQKNVKSNAQYSVTVMTMTYQKGNKGIYSDTSDVATNVTSKYITIAVAKRQ